MRVLIGLLLAGLVGLALLIYEVKYETGVLDARAEELNKAVQEERDAIAVLRAEWSLLNRPERVERLARKYLGLEPLQAQRLITLDGLDVQPMAQKNDDVGTTASIRVRPKLQAH